MADRWIALKTLIMKILMATATAGMMLEEEPFADTGSTASTMTQLNAS